MHKILKNLFQPTQIILELLQLISNIAGRQIINIQVSFFVFYVFLP